MHDVAQTDTTTLRRAASRIAAVSIGVALAMAVAACSGAGASPAASEPAASQSGSGADPVCADAAALETALADLQAVEIVQVGKQGLTTAVEDVRTAGAALKASAASDLAPAVETLDASIATLKTAVDALADGQIDVATLGALKTAITGVATSATALRTEIRSGPCPG